MDTGLKIWDAQGNLILGVTDRLCKILGKLDTADYIDDLNKSYNNLHMKPSWMDEATEAYQNGNKFWALTYAVYWADINRYSLFDVPTPQNKGNEIELNVDPLLHAYAQRIVYLCGVY